MVGGVGLGLLQLLDKRPEFAGGYRLRVRHGDAAVHGADRDALTPSMAEVTGEVGAPGAPGAAKMGSGLRPWGPVAPLREDRGGMKHERERELQLAEVAAEVRWHIRLGVVHRFVTPGAKGDSAQRKLRQGEDDRRATHGRTQLSVSIRSGGNSVDAEGGGNESPALSGERGFHYHYRGVEGAADAPAWSESAGPSNCPAPNEAGVSLP